MANEECDKLLDILGSNLLSKCTNVDEKALLEFSCGKRKLPEDIIIRLNFLLRVVNCLEGSYNKRGVCSWFYRNRTELGGRSPVDVLATDWYPDYSGPQKILKLAESLLG